MITTITRRAFFLKFSGFLALIGLTIAPAAEAVIRRGWVLSRDDS